MKTCGTCEFGVMVPQDINFVQCFGAPPTPVLMPVQVGQVMQAQIQLMRPNMARGERACSFHKSKILVGNDGDAAG